MFPVRICSVFAWLAIIVVVSAEHFEGRSLGGLFSSGGEPGKPGGMGGGCGGGGGGGGGTGGGSGGGGGLPQGIGEDFEEDYGLSLEDIVHIFGRPRQGNPSGKSESTRPKIKIGPECMDDVGVKTFAESKHTKKEWIPFLIKLVDEGKEPCAEELSKQLLIK